MRLLLPLSSFLSLSLAASIWPIPVSLKTGKDVVWFSRSTQFEYSGPQSVESPPSPELVANGACDAAVDSENPLAQAQVPGQRVLTNCWDEQTDLKYFKTRIEKAAERTKKEILDNNFVPWKFNPKGSKFEPDSKEGVQLGRVKLVQTDKEKRRPKAGEVDESYSLDLNTSGKTATAVITAKTSIGLLHGLQTFRQLFYKHSREGVYCNSAPVKILDKPKYPHRGLNLDVARQWYPVEIIKRQINALAVNKFNRLHFHVTDSQSWPLEIPAMPVCSSILSLGTPLTFPGSRKEWSILQGNDLLPR